MKKEKTFLQENWFRLSMLLLLFLGIGVVILIQINHIGKQEEILQKQLELKEKEIANQKEIEEKKIALEDEAIARKETEIIKQNSVQTDINKCILSAQNERKRREQLITMVSLECVGRADSIEGIDRCNERKDDGINVVKGFYLEWESNCKKGIKNNF